MKLSQLEKALEEKARKGEIKNYNPAKRVYFTCEIYKLLDEVKNTHQNRYTCNNSNYLDWLNFMANLKLVRKLKKPVFENPHHPNTIEFMEIREFAITHSGLELHKELIQKLIR